MSCGSTGSATRSAPKVPMISTGWIRSISRSCPRLSFPIGRAELTFGPRLRYSSTDFERRPVHQPGRLRGGRLRHARRDRSARAWRRKDQVLNTRRSLGLTIGGGVYPAVMDVEETFGEVHAEATGYLACAHAAAAADARAPRRRQEGLATRSRSRRPLTSAILRPSGSADRTATPATRRSTPAASCGSS